MTRTPEELERLIAEEHEASEASRDEPAPPGGVRRSGNRTKLFALRLTPAEHAEIQRLAKQAGIPASGLVRRWVEACMAAERDDSVEETVNSLSRDVERLRRQLIHA